MTKITHEDQIKMLKIKSLLNHLRYFIKDEDLYIADKYHTLCRKYCSWGSNKNEKDLPKIEIDPAKMGHLEKGAQFK